jgi:hypothetical protein
MKQEEFEKQISENRGLPLEYRNFETWGIAEFNWDDGSVIMTLDDEPREDAQIEIEFRRDRNFITENCWDFFVNFDRSSCGFGCSELKFFALILDILMDCEDDYPGKESGNG